jgi:retinol dehydrogenase-12
MTTARPVNATRTILVTGGNRGIGFAVVAALADRGDRVIFTSRDPERGRQALAQLTGKRAERTIRMEVCDLSSPVSIRAFARRLLDEATPIHGLINNAGVLRPPEERVMTEDGIEATLATNAIGPMLLTIALEPALRASAAKVLIVTSRLHMPGSHGDPVSFDFSDPNLKHDYSPDRAYKNSKLAAIWVIKELDRRMAPTVRCDAVCPGFVPATAAVYVTGWQRFLLRRVLPLFRFATTVEQAAADVVWALDAPELAGQGGQYLVDRRVAEPSRDACDEAKARQFWTLADQLIGGL